MKYALVAMFGLMIGGMMLGAMALSSGGGMLPGMLPLMTGSGSGGLGPAMWGLMLLPFVGMLIMIAAMYFFFRRMSGGGPMPGMMGHMGSMARRMGHGHAPESQGTEGTLTTLTYNIPAVHCPHCKVTIERELSQLAGVSSVSVDVDAREAVIRFEPPATRTAIEERLADTGYRPENPQ